jgi:hypothetical protein
MTPEMQRRPSFHTASATSGHTSDQEIAAPIVGLRLQPTWADEIPSATILHCGRSLLFRSRRQPERPVRQQFDQANRSLRPSINSATALRPKGMHGMVHARYVDSRWP